MSFAKKMQGVATKLLNKFDESDGTRLTLLKRGGEPVWYEILGEMVIQPDTSIKLDGVTVSFSSGLVNGTTIQTGDVMVIASASDSSIVISEQDRVKIGDITWSIVGQPIVDYTGVTICHKIHCRK